MDKAVLENQLASLKFKRVLIVLVLDATDLAGSLVPWEKLRVVVGTNPVLVAVTKCDLLPAVTQPMVDVWRDTVAQVCRRICTMRIISCACIPVLMRGNRCSLNRH